ncbi:hypothetical protein ABZ341_38895 [Streptomyces sp. NPDC006173]|uniref:DUF4760 domain-containing protein n=1 Tax=Streptomyces sp. NPDC006173 TaxID=3155349 RepID=UPI0033ED77B5
MTEPPVTCGYVLVLFHSNMDWIAFLSMLSAAAAVLYAVAISRDRRRQERRNLFLSLNEKLMHPDLQRGRALLRELIGGTRDADILFARQKDAHWVISQAVAMFDLLGLYVDRDYIDEDLVMAEWGRTLTRAYHGHGDYFIESRRSHLGWSPYPHFASLSEKAKVWSEGHPAT